MAKQKKSGVSDKKQEVRIIFFGDIKTFYILAMTFATCDYFILSLLTAPTKKKSGGGGKKKHEVKSGGGAGGVKVSPH